MKTPSTTRDGQASTPPKPPVPDLEVERMEGFYELGMHRRARAFARSILVRTTLDADVFARTLILVLSAASQLTPWISRVDQAWKRLPPRARRHARAAMLAFRYSTDTLDQALPLATVRPRDASDLMFSLAAFTHHRRERPVHRLIMVALRHLKDAKTDFERAMLLRAITHHHLSRKEWSHALVAASKMPSGLAFVVEQHRDMAAALQGSAEDALWRLDKLAKPDYVVSHPGLDAALIARARRRLTRLHKSVAWVDAEKKPDAIPP